MPPVPPKPAPPSHDRARRLLDIVVAAVALASAAPLMLLIAALIRRDSPGPALFRQTRAGRDGRPFTLLKFRTMRTDADPYGASPHAADDPRLTRFGRLLRETSLDELPQLWNVLRGDMTLVGPRPLYESQAAEWNERQRRRLTVRPGLTGLAQVCGRAALTIEEKLELDVQYVLNRGPRLDAWILWRTLCQLFGRPAIYEVRYSHTEEIRGAGDSIR
ncbi:MAG: sugar transferase [Phycisphaerae bacterium]|nr:sugar transferase [Phycisphaerae bacterium]NUQ47360.1 sugar transferase [Phycisphaerae bacterium]